MSWWLWGVICYSAALAVFTLVWMMLGAIRRHHAAEEHANMLQNEALLCAIMLREIAVVSFMQQHRGTFHAWRESMGNFRVSVTAVPRYPFGDD